MTEWWTYRLSDFLMFSPRTFGRLHELYNRDIWPLQLFALGAGALLWVSAWRGAGVSARIASALLAAAWLWVAWAFHFERYATINTAGPWFAAAFALEAVALGVVAALGMRWPPILPGDRRRACGLVLLGLAVAGYPLVGVLLGRPWPQAEVFGVAPDPTALGTLGLLLLIRSDAAGERARNRAVRFAWPLPVLWCFVSGATLWTLGAVEAPLLPALAVIGSAVALWPSRASSWTG